MSTYRAGQRVRVEWPDGSAAEGIVEWSNANGWAMPLGDIYVGLDALEAEPTSITVLSEPEKPRPEEPTGLGAVVEAIHPPLPGMFTHEHAPIRSRFIRVRLTWQCLEKWCDRTYCWRDLIDPVVLSEGWTPDE